MTTIENPDKVSVFTADEGDLYTVKGAKLKEKTNRLELKLPKSSDAVPSNRSLVGWEVFASDDGGAEPVYAGEIAGELTAGKMSARWRIFRCEPGELGVDDD